MININVKSQMCVMFWFWGCVTLENVQLRCSVREKEWLPGPVQMRLLQKAEADILVP